MLWSTLVCCCWVIVIGLSRNWCWSGEFSWMLRSKFWRPIVCLFGRTDWVLEDFLIKFRFPLAVPASLFWFSRDCATDYYSFILSIYLSLSSSSFFCLSSSSSLLASRRSNQDVLFDYRSAPALIGTSGVRLSLAVPKCFNSLGSPFYSPEATLGYIDVLSVTLICGYIFE